MTERLQILQEPSQTDTWLNSAPTTQMPVTTPATVTTTESRIRRKILDCAFQYHALPVEVRANPMTIVEMPCDQWTTFHINVRDRLITVPVVSDTRVPLGEIQCVIEDKTQELRGIGAKNA